MSARIKLGLYGALLAVMVGLGALVGNVVGPIDTGSSDPGPSDDGMHQMEEP